MVSGEDVEGYLIHWGLGIGSTDTEGVSVYVQEGALGIGTITAGLCIVQR